MRILGRLLRSIPLILISPIALLIPALTLFCADLLHRLAGRRTPPRDSRPNTDAATVVIPNWNGKDLLEKYLPPLIEAMRGRPDNEILVVDNGSTDGSAEFLRERFPEVRLLALPKNLGFGGGSNAGVAAASNDIVVLLNSDMRVEPGFLRPLLDAFTDERVFAVACQIFLSGPERRREETGLTEGWWEAGRLRVGHRIDDHISRPFPCFYGGGGSCAFDRRKFLELGGFDELLAPFYLEDTDLGFLAWKRGWKVLYQPASHVFHEHRGTIGKHFTGEQIQAVLQKNFILFAWKNIHEPRRFLSHLVYTYLGGSVSAVFGNSIERATFGGLWRAFRQLPGAVRSRWRARSLAIVDDSETFRRPLGGYFRDRFERLAPSPEPLRVLFVSPYPIYPPVHGGAVFMYQTLQELAPATELHVVVTLDRPDQRDQHAPLAALCASAEFHVRAGNKPQQIGSLTPYAVREFAERDLHWLIHRKLFLDRIDVLQLEYFHLGQYGGRYRRLACILFEHDIYFQSIARLIRQTPGIAGKLKPFYEYMRALRYELRLLPLFDRVQVCSRANARYLAGFLPAIADRIDADLRAGIDLSQYEYAEAGREPLTVLFVGSFRHLPNRHALDWFAGKVMPLVLAQEPRARLVVVGSDPPARHSLPPLGDALEFRGFVEDIREPLARYAVFACPVLSGSGVRVKLLEAFAAGLPVVSTALGAEGLTEKDGEICALADDPADFATTIVALLQNPEEGVAMARRARHEIEEHRDMQVITRRLVESYRATLGAKRGC